MTSLISKQLADGILARPFLKSIFVPFSNWYANAAGHQGPQAPLPKESYDRVFRIRRAVQLSYQHKLLPKNEWTKPEEDYPYLGPIIQQIQAEEAERLAFETIEVQKKHH
ncbi:cytochrome b-c1 complex subunit 7 [Colletotrichum spaethianum]|uniref:Complex III subunit 7 n=1 Tax=Colletotrichum spaethianum TaxID=700344 RepID=A0AA37LCR8_9PEZI|nr:cytochrome b-c1 complex subunit 7 [Colletotrichum spaethianum]GKT44934.1 cytochrome b-c1 complex subunit 7 [Colletotrichum spaethianum]